MKSDKISGLRNSFLKKDFEFGRRTLITFGLARVETMRKNRSRKNIISFSDEVLTSGLNCLFLLIFISESF